MKAKITHTVVDAGLMLVGLEILNEDDKTSKVFSLTQLKQMGFENNQILISGDKLELKGNFKLKDVPMKIYLGDAQALQPISNEIAVVGRVNNGTTDTGYVVESATGQKAVVNVEVLGKLNKLFSPKNFIVNKRSDTGKSYLTSKPGCPKISDLPIVGGIAAQLQNRAIKKNVVAPVKNNVSFWNLTKMIDTMQGVFIKLPNVKYNADTKMVVPTEKTDSIDDISKFGEFALPKLEVITTNANLNLSFRAKVKVKISDLDGNPQFDVWSNKISSKTVYKNGECNMSEIGILVKKSMKEQLMQVLTDNGIQNGALENAGLKKFYANSVGKNQPQDLCIIWISLKNIPEFVASDIQEFRASLPNGKQLVKDLFDYTCVKKALTEFRKIKKEAVEAGTGIQTIHPELQGYTEDQLKLIAAAGINLKFNTYTFKTEKTATSSGSDADSKANFAIKWEFTNLKNMNVQANEKLKNDVQALCQVLREYYINKHIDDADTYIQQTEESVDSFASAIQKLNIVMLYDGQFKYVKLPADPLFNAVPGKTNNYIVINTGDDILQQARAAVAGWEVK